MSTVCDPYQPAEEKFKLSRKCLKLIKDSRWPVSVLTRSSLVLRDIDVLSEIEKCEVGISITTIDDNIRKIFEPNSPPIDERLRALSELKKAGISTYAFIGPILPGDINRLIKNIVPLVDSVLTDKLNYPGKVRNILKKEGFDKWLDRDFNAGLKEKVRRRFEAAGVKVRY